MPTLADIYSAINTAKRKGSDFVQNPGTSLQQMLGNANDQARGFNQLNDQALAELEQTGQLSGPAGQQLMQKMGQSFEPAGMINKPMKGSKLVNVPIDMIEHGEAVMPGGTLTWPNARKKIEDYASKKTPLPPIDIVSPDGGVGKWMVADGSHRLEAAKLKGQATIPAYISPHDKEGLDMIAKYKMTAKDVDFPMNVNEKGNVMKTFKTSDGFTFYELPDGKIVDNLDPKKVDMSWDNYKQLKDDFGDDVYQLKDQLGERKAMVSSFGVAKPQELMDSYSQFMENPIPEVLYQRALNKQNAKQEPKLKLVKK